MGYGRTLYVLPCGVLIAVDRESCSTHSLSKTLSYKQQRAIALCSRPFVLNFSRESGREKRERNGNTHFTLSTTGDTTIKKEEQPMLISPRHTFRIYDEAFMRQAVKLVEESKHPMTAIARALGIHDNNLRKWVKIQHTPYLLQRRLHQDAPNRVWYSDITHLHTRQGVVYCIGGNGCVLTRRILGWHIGRTMKKDLVILSVIKAFGTRRKTMYAEDLMLHSDRGSQYASHTFRDLLSSNKIVQSISGKGDCWDNTLVESFFHTLKTETQIEEFLLKDFEEAWTIGYHYIDMYYNTVRLHSALGYKSPMFFEQQFTQLQLR
jgi:putative transposase